MWRWHWSVELRIRNMKHVVLVQVPSWGKASTCNSFVHGARTGFFAGVSGLRGVEITVPEAVPTGDIARLKCDYDLERELLYTIKWYRGDEEFYRFVPKESPPTRVFPLQGIHVDVSTTISLYHLLVHDRWRRCFACNFCWIIHVTFLAILFVCSEDRVLPLRSLAPW